MIIIDMVQGEEVDCRQGYNDEDIQMGAWYVIQFANVLSILLLFSQRSD